VLIISIKVFYKGKYLPFLFKIRKSNKGIRWMLTSNRISVASYRIKYFLSLHFIYNCYC